MIPHHATGAQNDGAGACAPGTHDARRKARHISTDLTSEAASGPVGGDLVKRHKLSTRIWHWICAALTLILLMSGLMIFNAHPRLYWGDYGANFDPAWLEIGAKDDRGYLKIGSAEFDTTGVLGVSEGLRGPNTQIAFPRWATLPSYYSLPGARRWHLTMAWAFGVGALLFGIWSLFNGHLRRDLLPRRHELSARHIWGQCRDHAMLQFPCGAEARKYNILQKTVYLGVTAGLIPVLILTGLSMSPWVNAQVPWLMELFGGRQSARSIHFIAAFLLVLFVVLHLAMVIASGPINELRSMITGWFRLPKERSR